MSWSQLHILHLGRVDLVNAVWGEQQCEGRLSLKEGREFGLQTYTQSHM
jgi:hypothetical protein